MEMNIIETEKYIVRPTSEKDFEDLKILLMENKYLSMLWSVSVLPEERLDELVRNLYIKLDNNYSVIDKQTDSFCGHMSIMQDEREGELSVRMREDVDMCEVLELFGKVLKNIDPAEQKNLTIQYCFE